MLRTTTLSSLLLALLFAAPAAPAQDDPEILGVLSTPLGPGDELVILADNLGAKKPKVTLGDAEGNKIKGTRVKVLELVDNAEEVAGQTLRCRLVKAPLGEYYPRVQVKGFELLVAEHSFSVQGPEVLSVDHAIAEDTPVAGTGDEILVTVARVGSKKGRVYIGDRRAKVFEQIPVGGLPTQKTLRARIPKQADGVFDVSVQNKLSRGFKHGALGVSGEATDKLGKPALNWVVEGAARQLRARGKRWDTEVVGEDLVLTGTSKRKGVTHQLEILFPASAVAGWLPTTLGEADTLLTYTRTSKAGVTVFKAGLADEGGPFLDIYLGALHGNRLAGSVDARLGYVSGPEELSIPFLDASFVVAVPDELLPVEL